MTAQELQTLKAEQGTLWKNPFDLSGNTEVVSMKISTENITLVDPLEMCSIAANTVCALTNELSGYKTTHHLSLHAHSTWHSVIFLSYVICVAIFSLLQSCHSSHHSSLSC